MPLTAGAAGFDGALGFSATAFPAAAFRAGVPIAGVGPVGAVPPVGAVGAVGVVGAVDRVGLGAAGDVREASAARWDVVDSAGVLGRGGRLRGVPGSPAVTRVGGGKACRTSVA